MDRTSHVHKHLFHYTDLKGLDGIIQNQSLWATHCRHLNDFSELILFKEIARDLVLPVMMEVYRRHEGSDPIRLRVARYGNLENAAYEHSVSTVNNLYRVTGENFYITSFCGVSSDTYVNDNGLLSQWRGYGDKQGFMVIFDTEKLEKLLQDEMDRYTYDQLHLSDVVYSHDTEVRGKELSAPIAALTDYISELFDHLLGRGGEPDATKTLPGFIQCITRYKHQGFKEENEVRIAGWLWGRITEEQLKASGFPIKPDKEVKHRGQNVPYVELFADKDVMLPIQKVVVGPSANKKDIAEEWKAKLDAFEIEVDVSATPFA